MEDKVVVDDTPRDSENSHAIAKVQSANMKFSIQNILGGNQETGNKQHVGHEESEDRSVEVRTDGHSSGEAELPWLQCTRYKPPKLQSKLFFRRNRRF